MMPLWIATSTGEGDGARRFAARLLRGICVAAILSLLALLLVDVGATAAPPPTGPAASVEGFNAAAALQVLRDPAATGAVRRAAVAGIADHGSPSEVKGLVDELCTTGDAAVRRAIVQGLRQAKRALPPAEAANILAAAEAMDNGLLEDVGEVISRAATNDAIKAMLKQVADPAARLNARIVIAHALAWQRSQGAAASLIDLLADQQPAPLRAAAMTALIQLSGIGEYGQRADLWKKWWAGAGQLSPAAWRDHLLENQARRADALWRDRQAMQDRLVQSMRQRYRAAAREERQGVLIGMLGDPLPALRELAIELTRELLTTEVLSADLTAGLLARLNDPAPALRGGAALLLRDLKNPAAADIIARRLAEAEEADPAVLRPYLLMMARQPRLAAVAPAVALLNDPTVAAEAAGALIAAFDADPPIISAAQAARVGQTLRLSPGDNARPLPAFVRLLGRVADADDWRRIEAWLDHGDPAVREAAAQAWAAAPDRSLDALAKRAADPVVQTILIPAAAQKGADAATLLAMASNKPKAEQAALLWGRSLVAIAGRAPPAGALKADAILHAAGESVELRQQLLSAAILQLAPPAPAPQPPATDPPAKPRNPDELAMLLIARAHVRLLAADPKAAEADLARVAELDVNLPVEQRDLISLAGLHSRLLKGEFDAAFALTERAFRGDADEGALRLRERMVDLILLVAEQALTARQADRANQILFRLRGALPGPLTLNHYQRITGMETKIKAIAGGG